MYIPLSFPDTKNETFEIKSFDTPDGVFHRLYKNGLLIMTNEEHVTRDYEDFLRSAKGSVLINGLGMGMCNEFLLRNRSISDVTVIEYDLSLINFIKPLLRKTTNLNIIHNNAFLQEIPKGKVYDYVWHDIWTVCSAENLDEMELLFEKYKDSAKWQGFWGKERCLELLKNQK